MNREIKFRGKRVNNGEWVEGYLIIEPNGSHWIDFYPDGNRRTAQVISETVGQFTGLNDCTKWTDLTEQEREKWILDGKMPAEWFGKEIFEGNIVQVDNDENPVNTICKYEPGIFVLEDNAGGHWTRQLLNQQDRLKIIGNFYENPELL